MPSKKYGKIDTKLMNLSTEESNKIGLEVERLIKDEMSYIVNDYISKYRHACADTFGWDRDDLMQHIRESLWRGVATFNPNYGYKIETYLSSILKKSFLNLSRKCKTKKHSLTKLYCPEDLYESGEMIFNETGEDWVRYSQNFSVIVGKMNSKEQKIMVRYLVYNETVEKIAKSTKFKKTEIVRCLKSIKATLKETMEIGNEGS